MTSDERRKFVNEINNLAHKDTGSTQYVFRVSKKNQAGDVVIVPAILFSRPKNESKRPTFLCIDFHSEDFFVSTAPGLGFLLRNGPGNLAPR